MSHRPLFGHHSIRERLASAYLAGRLPASLLFQGPLGVGKQRLAIWLGQLILCERVLNDGLKEPCGECIHCRYVVRGQHPDLHWFFPRTKIKESEPEISDAREDMAEGIAERMANDGLWTAPPGSDGIFVVMVRALVQEASLRPAMAARSVFVVGDAERMVSQSSSPEAANAFLKLLEEPPPNCTIVVTSSEAGALLPTIRSRTVSIRVPLLAPADVRAFVADQAVAKRLKDLTADQAVALAAGAPGAMLNASASKGAFVNAQKLLDAALLQPGPAGAAERIKVTARQGVVGARGAFSDTLDALVVLLHQRARALTLAGHERQARLTAQAVVAVQYAKDKAQQNVSPQLLAAGLMASLHQLLKP